jgi:hypothetical protein
MNLLTGLVTRKADADADAAYDEIATLMNHAIVS